MRRGMGSSHPVARRVAVAAMTVLTASGIGLVAAPMAFGQIVIPIGNFGNSQSAGVTNSGSASANSGGNTAIGNASTNTHTQTAPASSGLLNVPVSLGAPNNTSNGAAAVTTGPATAVGNDAGTSVGQSDASGNQVNAFLNAQRQNAGVTNAGSGSANSGGNTAIGNGSQNTTTQEVSGGLLGVGVTLGGPVNNSVGSATINSGAANATGNDSSTQVGQSSVGGAGGSATRAGVGAIPGLGGAGVGAGPCSASRFGSFQNVDVRNQGEAEANTGNNVAIGNASNNETSATAPGQTVSGGLLGVGITIGGPINNSSGVAVINTGPANAVGNNSTTQVGQVEGCPQVVTLAAAGGRPGIIVPAGHVVQRVGTATLARTGLDTGDLGMIAGALLGAGMLLVASQRRRAQARALAAAVPMAGFGLGLGADDWDRTVR
jgi:hypothetical protein